VDINIDCSSHLSNVSGWFSSSSNECAILSAQFRASSAENVIPTRILRLITRGVSSFVTCCAVVFPKEKRILGYGFFRLEWMKFHFHGISRNFFGALSRIWKVLFPPYFSHLSEMMRDSHEVRYLSDIINLLIIINKFLGNSEIFDASLSRKCSFAF